MRDSPAPSLAQDDEESILLGPAQARPITYKIQEPEIPQGNVEIMPNLAAINKISVELMSNRVEWLSSPTRGA